MTPRYDDAPALQADGLISDPSIPLLRQRRRFADVLALLEPEQWSSATRCERWSVQDVVMHLVGVNQLWQLSFEGAHAGTPTRLFQYFDPAVTPAQHVAAMPEWTPSETLARFVETNDALAAVLADSDEDTWAQTGESPLGHVTLRLVAVHALWDSWIHERDVLLPLGITPVEEPDEVLACLWYAAALGPALLATRGSTRHGTLAVDATDPRVQVVITAGPHVTVVPGVTRPDLAQLSGHAAELAEGLSFRQELAVVVASDDRWLLSGLDAAFDHD